MIAADWTNFVVGIRQDITYKWLDQAVISDDDGKVILNLAQQDCTAMRVVFRAGFQVANPINSVEPPLQTATPRRCCSQNRSNGGGHVAGAPSPASRSRHLRTRTGR